MQVETNRKMYCRNQLPHWVLHLLSKYPGAARVTKATVNKLSKIRYISESKAESIIKKARQSVVNDTQPGHDPQSQIDNPKSQMRDLLNC